MSIGIAPVTTLRREAIGRAAIAAVRLAGTPMKWQARLFNAIVQDTAGRHTDAQAQTALEALEQMVASYQEHPEASDPGPVLILPDRKRPNHALAICEICGWTGVAKDLNSAEDYVQLWFDQGAHHCR